MIFLAGQISHILSNTFANWSLSKFFTFTRKTGKNNPHTKFHCFCGLKVDTQSEETFYPSLPCRLVVFGALLEFFQVLIEDLCVQYSRCPTIMNAMLSIFSMLCMRALYFLLTVSNASSSSRPLSQLEDVSHINRLLTMVRILWCNALNLTCQKFMASFCCTCNILAYLCRRE